MPPYAKTDCVNYSLDWIYTENGDKLNVTKYLLDHSSEEGLTIENNRVTFNFKLIKDKLLNDGTLAPFFADNDGVSRLSTEGLLQPYFGYLDGVTPIFSNDNLYKTYYITDWTVSEPENALSISAVDLAYKITNRNISYTYTYKYFESSGFTYTSNTLTDTSKSFPIPRNDSYDLGLKYMTLELIDEEGNIYLYLITNNTKTKLTLHKNIDVPVGSFVSYRIGFSAPLALYDAINRVSRPDDGSGEIYRLINMHFTMDVSDKYSSGIQLLRKKGNTTEAFPIVDIGEPFMPVYKLLNELSSYTACNTENELDGNLVIKRDMVFAVVWNDFLKKTDVKWFYPDVPVIDTITKSITNVTNSSVTLTNPTINDRGKLLRVKYVRGGAVYYKTYEIVSVNGSVYTLSDNPVIDGIKIGDEARTLAGVDFVWDNDDDYKHIYNYTLGSKDEEKFNTIYFVAGINEISNINVAGFYFFDETQSDTLKDTFIPMTGIAKKMMNWITTGEDGVKRVFKKEDDVWLGWNETEQTFKEESKDWEFTTTFGTSNSYRVTSRANFNLHFRECAKQIGKAKSRAICVSQKENTLAGTFEIRGQKHIKTDDTGSLANKWYDKGTRILFVKKDAGLANDADKYFLFTVTKVKHRITETSWTTTLDVEYDLYDLEELIKTEW